MSKQSVSGAAADLNNSLLLPSASNSIGVPAIVPQKLNAGSATGNPRNKCALKPGHSLMDWIRLGNSGVDLAGTGGREVPVSSEELAKHNSQYDAWLAIRGRVYNVSRYMDFHPGGVAELMRGIGQDATKLFDEVHAWVNYQQLLAKCYIGPLRNVVKLDADLVHRLHGKETTTKADLPPPKPVDLPEIVPRLDWLQQKNQISFYIYTKYYCNPGLMLERKTANTLHICVLIEHVHYMLELQLQAGVEWPPINVKVNNETGKIEMTFKKNIIGELWSSYGTHSIKKLLPRQYEHFHYEIVRTNQFNHDSVQLSLRCLNEMIMLPPLGYHVSITATLNDQCTQSRSYTPVMAKFFQRKESTTIDTNENTNLFLLVKMYPNGTLSTHIGKLPKGATLALSAPKGNFKLQQLLKHRCIAFLAAGSGLTPFLNLIGHLLQRISNRIEYLLLMYFNKTESDIWCKESLTQLQAHDERFEFVNILSQANETQWAGLKGRVSISLLENLAKKDTSKIISFVGICGPDTFNQMAAAILKQLQFGENQMHIFRA